MTQETPLDRDPRLSESFDLVPPGGSKRAALLLHGFTGTPFAMRFLGDQLAAARFRARAIALPGHGPDAANLATSTASDWLTAANEALDELRRDGAPVFVIGQSMGALLSLQLAASRPSDVEAVVAIATPLWLRGAAGVVSRLLRFVPTAFPLPVLTKGESDCRDDDARRQNPANDKIPLTALRQFDVVRRNANAVLSQVTVPVLAIHARDDHTAPYACSSQLLRRIASTHRRLRTLTRSFHLATIDVEKDVVAREITDFLNRIADQPTRSKGAVQPGI